MTIPVCSKCRRISVLNPCRQCATVAELEKYPDEPDDLVGMFSPPHENPEV